MERLSNGVTFVTRPDTIAPRVALSLVIRAGAADETAATAGWRRLLVNAMLRGVPKGYETGKTDVEVNEGLSRAAEKAGGFIGATVGDDFVEVYVTGDAAKAPALLDLALAFWRNPRLSDDDIKLARERTELQLDGDDLDTASKTQAALRSQLFRDARGELSAYGLPDFGTSASLDNLTNEKLRELYATKLATARVTVAASGNFDAAALREKLESLPASASREPATPIFAPPKTGTPALVVRELPIPSAWVFVSYPLAGNTQNDAAALRVMAAVLGDSAQARLPERLLKSRVMGGSPPAITIAAQYIPRRYAGELVIYAQTGPQNVERVKNALLDEIRKLRDAPISKSELQSAKLYSRGSWSIERQGLRERAFQSALGPAVGGATDVSFPARLQKVTAADVQKAAQKYLKAYAVALVMPANQS
jgi:predicted Zn-dependent peptidase